MSYIIVLFSAALVIGFLLGWIIHSVYSKNTNFKDPKYETHLQQMLESLSAKALHNNSNFYLQQSSQHLQNILAPLYKDLQKLDQQIQQVEKTRVGDYSNISSTVQHLHSEIKNLYSSNQTLQKTTQQLNQALRSDHSTRGKWGEIQLRRIAEITGMIEHIDFEEQISFSNQDSTIRPDMIIHMPHEGIIPVDAKAPMNAYLNACNANSKEEEQAFLQQHSKAMEGHLRTLSKKEYWNQDTFPHSPQLVVMFVPYESGLEASLSLDTDLLDKALSNRVIIAGPSSLYGLLKVISYGWMQLSLTKNTEKIYKLSKDLFQRFSIFFNHYSKLGLSLDGAVKSFNAASNSLQSRLIPTLHAIESLSEADTDIPKSQDIPIVENSINSNVVTELQNSTSQSLPKREATDQRKTPHINKSTPINTVAPQRKVPETRTII